MGSLTPGLTLARAASGPPPAAAAPEPAPGRGVKVGGGGLPDIKATPVRAARGAARRVLIGAGPGTLPSASAPTNKKLHM